MIQGFNKIIVLFILILKIIRLPNKLALNKNNNSKSAFIKNDSSRPFLGKNNGNNEVRFNNNSIKHIKKLKKLKS